MKLAKLPSGNPGVGDHRVKGSSSDTQGRGFNSGSSPRDFSGDFWHQAVPPVPPGCEWGPVAWYDHRLCLSHSGLAPFGGLKPAWRYRSEVFTSTTRWLSHMRSHLLTNVFPPGTQPSFTWVTRVSFKMGSQHAQFGFSGHSCLEHFAMENQPCLGPESPGYSQWDYMCRHSDEHTSQGRRRIHDSIALPIMVLHMHSCRHTGSWATTFGRVTPTVAMGHWFNSEW